MREERKSPAADQPAIRERIVSTNGVDLHVVDAGDGPPVILSHGFPELSYSWRHQVPALAAAGYRVLAPDQRGYGRSSRPSAIDDYDIVHLTDDLLGLLDDIGEERAVFVGHDWGAMVVWTLAQLAPERVAGVVGMSVPFLPRAPMPPTQLLRQVLGDAFFYILYFQEPGKAEKELEADVRRTMRSLLFSASGDPVPGEPRAPLHKSAGFLDQMQDPTELPSWLSDADLDFYTGEFARSGFRGGLNWYRNMDRNWDLMGAWATAKITVPALFIAGDRDPVLTMIPGANMMDVMKPQVPNLKEVVMVPGAGHWTQQERPAEVNAAMITFLRGL